MTVTTIDVQDAQTQLLQLLALVLKGGDVVVAKDNVPVARLVPVESPKKARTPGLQNGAIRMSDDFNDPLPDGFWTGGA